MRARPPAAPGWRACMPNFTQRRRSIRAMQVKHRLSLRTLYVNMSRSMVVRRITIRNAHLTSGNQTLRYVTSERSKEVLF
jgi:hypothetical protein